MLSERLGATFEINCCPVALDFFYDAREIPFWASRWLRHQSGWLAIGTARLDTLVDSYHKTLVAGVTGDGDILKPWQRELILSLPCSLPQDAPGIPPDELEEALGIAYWDFLGNCDLDQLSALQKAEDDLRQAITDIEDKTSVAMQWNEQAIARLNRRLRMGNLSKRVADTMRERAESLDAELDDLVWQQMRQIHKVRKSLARLEDDVMESLTIHGEMDEPAIIHWTARRGFASDSLNVLPQIVFGEPADKRPSPYAIWNLVQEARFENSKVRAAKRAEIEQYWLEQEEKRTTERQTLKMQVDLGQQISRMKQQAQRVKENETRIRSKNIEAARLKEERRALRERWKRRKARLVKKPK